MPRRGAVFGRGSWRDRPPGSISRSMRAWGAVSILVALSACGESSAPSPFQGGSGGDGVAGGGGASAGGGAGGFVFEMDPDQTLGGPCQDDGQCDDALDCTDDSCDLELGRCRFRPRNERCADEVYCDGAEICEPGVGCREGIPVACSDGTTCTIDTCVEETRSCKYEPRDADGDGDPVANCGGGDCDDDNPLISSQAAEVCGNQRDDDCDAVVDESDCEEPRYDTCVNPLVIEGSGIHELPMVAAREDASLSCVPSGGSRRDLVAALVIAEEGPHDVDLTLIGPSTAVAISVATDCSDPSTELVCQRGVQLAGTTGSVARVLLRGLEAGAYPVFLSDASDDTVILIASYGELPPAPENETCGTALDLEPNTHVQVNLAGTTWNLPGACERPVGDVVYRFELDEAHDVEARAFALDDYGVPTLTLRDATCTAFESEIGCRTGAPATLFARALPAGTYYLGVGSTGPAEVDAILELKPSSAPPPEEGCEDPPELVLGETQSVDLSSRVDGVDLGCLTGAADAVYALSLEQASDVLLVERLSPDDTGAVSLVTPSCRSEERLACASLDRSPVRAVATGVSPGQYRVVAESAFGAEVSVAAYARPAAPPYLVAFSDTCEDAITIPETGGRFIGNTQNANPDYAASCDFGGAPSGGGRDQMMKLNLSERRRVILDMGGSDYETLLVVREANECPGREVPLSCVPGYVVGRSYLELTLDAGDYYVQVDGYGSDSGPWRLDVFLSDP